ncbi:MAG: DNA-directed RNA polymerase subunit N [Candidatus Micrarchaeota archaeon]
MEFPVRCFTCGGLVGHLYEKYKELLKSKGEGEALDELGVERYCCRRMFIAHVDMIGEVSKYPRR